MRVCWLSPSLYMGMAFWLEAAETGKPRASFCSLLCSSILRAPWVPPPDALPWDSGSTRHLGFALALSLLDNMVMGGIFLQQYTLPAYQFGGVQRWCWWPPDLRTAAPCRILKTSSDPGCLLIPRHPDWLKGVAPCRAGSAVWFWSPSSLTPC